MDPMCKGKWLTAMLRFRPPNLGSSLSKWPKMAHTWGLLLTIILANWDHPLRVSPANCNPLLVFLIVRSGSNLSWILLHRFGHGKSPVVYPTVFQANIC